MNFKNQLKNCDAGTAVPVTPECPRSAVNQKSASLQTQGSSLQPPLLNSNNPSYPSNRPRGRGNHHNYQSRNNTNQHYGNSRFLVCNSQNGGYTCTRRVYEGTNFCPDCGVPTQNHPSRGGHLPVRRGGRAIGRGRGRGNFRGGNTGSHRGYQDQVK